MYWHRCGEISRKARSIAWPFFICGASCAGRGAAAGLIGRSDCRQQAPESEPNRKMRLGWSMISGRAALFALSGS